MTDVSAMACDKSYIAIFLEDIAGDSLLSTFTSYCPYIMVEEGLKSRLDQGRPEWSRNCTKLSPKQSYPRTSQKKKQPDSVNSQLIMH